MNLQDLINRKTTVTHHQGVIEYEGQDIEFYTRPLLAADQEKLLMQIGDSLPAVQKIQEAAKNEEAVASISGKDFVLLQTTKRQYAACVLCDSQGKKMFTNYNKMINSMDSELIDLISNYIDDHVKDEETTEAIEKN